VLARLPVSDKKSEAAQVSEVNLPVLILRGLPSLLLFLRYKELEIGITSRLLMTRAILGSTAP